MSQVFPILTFGCRISSALFLNRDLENVEPSSTLRVRLGTVVPTFWPVTSMSWRARQTKEIMMTRARVLIAEDESLIAEELRGHIERMGLTVTAVVRSGEDAIARAEETFPDLVLMDVQLKGRVDGFAAASAIRERFDIPVIYLTALSDDVTVERAEQTSPLGYLLKPVAEKELQIAVKMALQYHGLRSANRAVLIFRSKWNLWAPPRAHPVGDSPSRHSPSPSHRGTEATPFSPANPPPPT